MKMELPNQLTKEFLKENPVDIIDKLPEKFPKK